MRLPLATAISSVLLLSRCSGGGGAAQGPPAPATSAPVAPPTLSLLSPNSGSAGGGQTVTLHGANFAAGATVTMGLLPATVLSVTPTAISAITPVHAPGAVDVTVANPDGQTSASPGLFTYTAPAAPGTPPLDTRPAPGSLGGSGNNRWQIGSPTGLYVADPAAGELVVQGATAGSPPLILVNLDKGKPPADTLVTLNGVALVRWPGNPDFMWTLDPSGPQPVVGTGGFIELVATSGGGRQRQLILQVPGDVVTNSSPAIASSLAGSSSLAITFSASLTLNPPGIPGLAGVYPTASLLGYDPASRLIPSGAHGQSLVGAGQLGVVVPITSSTDTTQYLLDLRWPGLWQPDGETGAFCGLVKRWIYTK